MDFSFQTRIVSFVLLLFAGVQAITLVTVYQTTRSNVIKQVGQNLSYAQRIFDRLLNERGERIASETTILSADFGFRSTISSGDPVTIRSALENLILRTHAQRAFFVDMDGKVAADTDQKYDTASFPFSKAINLAPHKSSSVYFVLIDSKPHVLATVPVLAPLPIGWISIATRVDNRFLENIKKLFQVSLEITIAAETPQGLHRLASTLAETLQKDIDSLSIDHFQEANDSPTILEFAGRRWVTFSSPLLSAREDQQLSVVLQYELEGSLKPYKQLWYSTAGLFGFGLFGILFGGVAIARQISRPVRQLARAAQRVGRGDFGKPVNMSRRDELGRLAQAFNLMMQGIADREARIAHQLRHDPITDLPNRLFFEENLIARFKQDCGYLVALIGLDRYAEINSTLGHGLGDKLIRAIGMVLKNNMPVDAELAHMAGDEFALMVPSPGNENSLRHIAELILHVFEESITLGPTTIDVSVHIGIVHYPKDGQDAQTLLRKADAALFVARRSGHGYHIYKEETDPCQPEALSLMRELRLGLDTGHFKLYVQPLLDLRLMQVTHVECLIRWFHPERGFMPPDHFIPLAEQTGHISRVTAWVLNEAFRLRNEWQEAGLETRLAVNLSAKDLLHGNLPKLLDDLLAKFPVKANDFMLEITESSVMQDAEQALKVIKHLRAQGFQIAADDFGTGYSSMAYLKKLQLNELKIDKSFILNLANNPEDSVIVRSIIDLGHNLGLKVVAEGIENQESLALLELMGCDLAQGYWISRPMPSIEFYGWLKQSSR
ncbi:MAG: EAL domain-containing protein [Methylococcaceae bacterium]|nr:EAL domain-containing protein [Methylococcaceae bacterium]